MKKTTLLLLFLLMGTYSFSQTVIKEYIYVEATNTGAVQSILLENLGNNFLLKGNKKIWQKKELNYLYRVTYRKGKLRIYYKGIHDEIEEKLKYIYQEIQALT